MTDQELIKAFLELGPKFSELQKMFLEFENYEIQAENEVGQSCETKTGEEEEDGLKNQAKYRDYDFEDLTVPRGWGSKIIRNNGDPKDGQSKVFLSPSGQMFLTRRSSLELMMEESFPEEDVQLMRSHCRNTDSKSTDSNPSSKGLSPTNHSTQYSTNDPTIPKGWSSKLVSNGSRKAPKKIYRSPQGQVFHSRLKALEFMMKNCEKFSRYEIEKMKQHIHPNVIRKEKANLLRLRSVGGKSEVEKEEDEKIEEKTKDNKREEEMEEDRNEENKKYEKDDDDEMEEDKVEKMDKEKEEDEKVEEEYEKEKDEKEKYEEEEEDKKGLMMESSSQCWLSDERLPPGWLYSFVVQVNQSQPDGYYSSIIFTTDEGTQIQSYGKALKFMRSNPKYSNSEIESFASFYRKREDCRENVEPHDDLVKDELFIDTETQNVTLDVPADSRPVTSSPKKKIRGSGRYSEHPLLPAGWQVAIYPLSKGGTLVRFKTPDGETIHSRKKVVKILESQGYSRSELENVAKIRTTKDEYEAKNESLDDDNIVADISDVESNEMEFSLISESELGDTSANTILDVETIMGLTEEDFELVGDSYTEESQQGEVSPSTEDQETLSSEENDSVGPNISFTLESFDILSGAFQENNQISMEEISHLSDITSLPQKDVKWFFLKVRHLVQGNNVEGQEEQISDLLESLQQTSGENDFITI